eukprot:364605-Chlamydomonas_euryale.AAC.10
MTYARAKEGEGEGVTHAPLRLCGRGCTASCPFAGVEHERIDPVQSVQLAQAEPARKLMEAAIAHISSAFS